MCRNPGLCTRKDFSAGGIVVVHGPMCEVKRKARDANLGSCERQHGSCAETIGKNDCRDRSHGHTAEKGQDRPFTHTSYVPSEVHCAGTDGDGLVGSILLLGRFGDHGLRRDQEPGD
jgi:hypothetical protein